MDPPLCFALLVPQFLFGVGGTGVAGPGLLRATASGAVTHPPVSLFHSLAFGFRWFDLVRCSVRLPIVCHPAHTPDLNPSHMPDFDRFPPNVERLENDKVFKRLCRVQMWKQFFHKLRYGVADRPLNFNKVRRSPCPCVYLFPVTTYMVHTHASPALMHKKCVAFVNPCHTGGGWLFTLNTPPPSSVPPTPRAPTTQPLHPGHLSLLSG